MGDMYEVNLDKNKANFTPLSPLSFLERTAEIYPNRKSIIHGNKQYTWLETYNRSKQLASCLLYTSPSPRDRTRSRMPSSA